MAHAFRTRSGGAWRELHGPGGCRIGGGFYNPAIGKRWLERSGASVMVHEFGVA
jgi:hypothetical protein